MGEEMPRHEWAYLFQPLDIEQVINGVFQALKLPRSLPGSALVQSARFVTQYRQTRYAFRGN